MSFANVILYLAILCFIVYRRVQGKPAGSMKQLFILPIVLSVLGYQDLAHKSLDTIDVVFAVAGCGVSLVLGAVRGVLDKIEFRDGAPWVRWGAASVVVFGVNIAAKLILDVVSVVAGGTTSGAISSLLLAAGLMLAGEAAVVGLRLQTGPAPVTGGPAAAPMPSQGWPVQPSDQGWPVQPPSQGRPAPRPIHGSPVQPRSQAPQPTWTPPPANVSRPAGASVRDEASRLAEGLLRRLADRRNED
jgi:hypothetical protein